MNIYLKKHDDDSKSLNFISQKFYRVDYVTRNLNLLCKICDTSGKDDGISFSITEEIHEWMV